VGADILLDRLYDGSIRSVSDFTIAPIQKHGSNKSYQQINAKNIIFIQKHGSINDVFWEIMAEKCFFSDLKCKSISSVTFFLLL
jgi:hypothetical protein